MAKKTKDVDNNPINSIKKLLSPLQKNKKNKDDNKENKKNQSSKKGKTAAKTTEKKEKNVKKGVNIKNVQTKISDTPVKSTSKNAPFKINSSSKEKKEITNKTVKASETKKVPTFSPEYYDLPYRYNQTVVKILAQTPTNLFVYWEISDEDRESLKKQYGDYLFEITKPVLVVHNKTLHYSFEIDINDFANSWYFHVNDSDCEYQIELGRRPIPINYSYMPKYDVEKNGPIKPVKSSYIYITSSNDLRAPNDHILFNNKNKIYFKNVKTNETIEKDISEFPFMVKNDKFVSVYELYKELYNNGEILDDTFDRLNPSSGNPSSKTSSW